MAIVWYCSLFHFKELHSKMTFFMMISVFLISHIYQTWVYKEEIDTFTKTDEQRQFYIWLWIEVLLFYGSILGGALYILLCTCCSRQVHVYNELQAKSGE